MICDCCQIIITDHQVQYIEVLENFGPNEDDEYYHFCSIKCMLGWYV